MKNSDTKVQALISNYINNKTDANFTKIDIFFRADFTQKIRVFTKIEQSEQGDIVQEAIIKLYRRLQKEFVIDCRTYSYCCAIFYNLKNTYFQNKQKINNVELHEKYATHNETQSYLDKLDNQTISSSLLKELEPHKRDVFLMYYFKNQSIQCISKITDYHPEKIKTILYQGRIGMKARLVA